MSITQIIDFIHGVAVLLSIGILFDLFITSQKTYHSLFRKLITGFFISIIGIIIMSTPWEFSPGYFFDPRTVVSLISSLFFGFIPSLIAMMSLSAFRIYEGGGGVVPGVLWVLIPGISGLLWRRLRKQESPMTFRELYVLSLIVHVLVLLSLFTLSAERALELIQNVAIPIMIIFPLGAALLGTMLVRHKERLESEKKITQLATVIEQLNEKIIITDLHGRPVYLNRYFEESTGYAIDEVLGRELGDFKSGLQEETFYKNLWHTISSGKTWRGRIVNKRKDDSIYYDEATIFPVMDEEGEIINYASFQRDITEQMEMIKALENSEENLKTILNSIRDAVVALDERNFIIDINPPAENLTGWSKEEILGKPVNRMLKFIGQNQDGDSEAFLRRIFGSDSFREGIAHLDLESRSGKITSVSVSGASFVGMKEDQSGVVLLIRDITEEIKMREMMVQNEKMLSIGGLAAGMAHEINNPLAGMIQSADVIANRISKNLHSRSGREAAEKAGTSIEAVERFMKERDIFRMLKGIKDSGMKAAKIIENMISFSQSAKKGKRYYNPVEIIESSLEILKSDKEIVDVKVTKKIPHLLPELYCERAKMQQVFLNLIRNSLQAFNEDYEIPPEIIIAIQSGLDNYMVFTIEDNGAGMEEEVRKHIFEPFYSTRDVGAGVGLGLSVAYYIVTEEHKGKLQVQSKKGEGTTIRITLPLH